MPVKTNFHQLNVPLRILSLNNCGFNTPKVLTIQEIVLENNVDIFAIN